MSTEDDVLGQYWPGISIDAEPPPYSPPMPSRAAALAAVRAAVSAAFRAIAAEDEADAEVLRRGGVVGARHRLVV